MELPNFKYHPDPIATGSIQPSDARCECCGQRRGYIYTSPVYALEELEACICPWCIADGSAHEKYDAEFVDAAAVGGSPEWDTVPQEVVEEVAYRTPGFSGWQQEQWWTHCGDAAEFLGPAGYRELQQQGGEIVAYFRELFSEETALQGEELEHYFKAFDREHGPTAYIFRCRHCGKLGGYWDCH